MYDHQGQPSAERHIGKTFRNGAGHVGEDPRTVQTKSKKGRRVLDDAGKKDAASLEEEAKGEESTEAEEEGKPSAKMSSAGAAIKESRKCNLCWVVAWWEEGGRQPRAAGGRGEDKNRKSRG